MFTHNRITVNYILPSHLLLFSVDNDQISSSISAELPALRPALQLTGYEKPAISFQ